MGTEVSFCPWIRAVFPLRQTDFWNASQLSPTLFRMVSAEFVIISTIKCNSYMKRWENTASISQHSNTTREHSFGENHRKHQERKTDVSCLLDGLSNNLRLKTLANTCIPQTTDCKRGWWQGCVLLVSWDMAINGFCPPASLGVTCRLCSKVCTIFELK